MDFVDMKARDEKARARLKARVAELTLKKSKLGGNLPPDEEAELVAITAALAKKTGDDMVATVDEFFINTKEKLAKSIGANPIDDHVDGLLPTSRTKPPTKLTAAERQLAAVFGILEMDSRDNFKSSRFTGWVTMALGEYANNLDLFTRVLDELIADGDIVQNHELNAEHWVAVVRSLKKDGVQHDNSNIPTLVRSALAKVLGADIGRAASTVDISLPDLEDLVDIEIVVDNLHATQALFFAAMLEKINFFQVPDKLLEQFQYGQLPLGKGNAGDYLYTYWRKSIDRFNEVERRNLYARCFGFPGGSPTAGSPNRDFEELWMRFISAVSNYYRQIQVDNLLRTLVPVQVSQEAVRKAARDLAANLSLHGYGIAYFAATELQAQINDIITLLSDEEIKNSYGARDMWQVIDQVSTLELGGPRNSTRYRTMAHNGAVIIRWLANNASRLSGSSLVPVLDTEAIRSQQTNPEKATIAPTDYELYNACEQYLAVTGTPEQQVEIYAQPSVPPTTTSRPIQIPAIAREMLESAGVPIGLGMSSHRGYDARATNGNDYVAPGQSRS